MIKNIFFLLILFSCSSKKNIKQSNELASQNGIFIFYGNSDISYSDMFIKGDFRKEDCIKKLASLTSLKADEYTLSSERRSSLISKGTKYNNDDNYIGYTNGSKDVYLLPVRLKYNPPKNEIKDPTNFEKSTSLKFGNTLISFTSLYSKNEIVEILLLE